MRDKYWDIVKGMGVVQVLMVHTGSFLAPYLDMYTLAIFFFVAGYFYKDKYTAEPFHYIGTRLQSLWWPCVKYGFLFVCLHNLLFGLGIYSDAVGVPLVNERHMYDMAGFLTALWQAVTLHPLEEMALALWFIIMMIADLAIFCALSHLGSHCQRRWQQEAVLLGGVAAIYAAGCWLIGRGISLDYYFQLSCVLLLPTYMGYAWRRWGELLPLHWLWSLLGLAVVVYVYRRTGTWVDLSMNRILGPKWFLLVTVAGMGIHLGFCRLLAVVPWLADCMAYAGRYSLHIIALHFLAFKVAAFVYIKAHGLSLVLLACFPAAGYPMQDNWWWLLYLACGFVLPLGAVAVWEWLAGHLRA